MTVAIADTTVVVHLYRRYAPALTWYGSLSQPLGITPITWMEVMYGAGSKAKQSACKTLLSQFDLIHLTSLDQDWAMQQMEKYRRRSPGRLQNTWAVITYALKREVFLGRNVYNIRSYPVDLTPNPSPHVERGIVLQLRKS